MSHQRTEIYNFLDQYQAAISVARYRSFANTRFGLDCSRSAIEINVCAHHFVSLFTTLIARNGSACYSTVTLFAKFLGLCSRITSFHEVSVSQTPQRPSCAVPVIQRSHSLQDCGVCPHPSLAQRPCDTPAAAAAPHAASGSRGRNARACE